MVFYAAFNSISVISRRQFTLFMSFLDFTSTRLGSEVSCPRTLPRKNPEDPVRLETRTPGLQVKHSTTEPPGTLRIIIYKSKTTVFSFKRQRIITSLFRKLTKISKNYFKIGIKGTSGQLEMCKDIVSAKMLQILHERGVSIIGMRKY